MIANEGIASKIQFSTHENLIEIASSIKLSKNLKFHEKDNFVNVLGVKKELDHIKPLPKDIFIAFVKSQYEDKSSDAKKKLKISQ